MEEIVHRTVTADNYESMTLKDVREQLQQELGWSDEQWKEHKEKVKQAVTERVQELGEEPTKSKKLKRKSKGDDEIKQSPKKKTVQKKEKKEKKEKAKKKPVKKAKSTAAKRSPYYKKLTELAGAKKIK